MLVINGKVYRENKTDSIPETAKSEPLHTKQHEGVTYFFGRQSKLSNFHPTPFKLYGETFSTVEQCYQKTKFEFYRAQRLAAKIANEI